MTIDFQKDLLRVLIQSPSFRKYIPQISEDIFDMPESQVIFQLLQNYVEKYRKQPEYSSMMEWWSRVTKKQSIEENTYKSIQVEIASMYEEYRGDTGLLEDTIAEQIQYKMAKVLFQKYASQLSDGIDIYRKMRIELNDIIDFDTEETTESEGKYLFKEFDPPKRGQRIGQPTFLKALNRMTAAGGFHTPQLVIIMGTPKGFKTGTVMNLALSYAIDGLKVFYADTENGLLSIENRFKQAMAKCTYQELFSGDLNDILEEQSRRMQVMGGEIRMERFPAHTKSINDIEAKLDELRDEDGWVPDLIIYDYLDLFLANDPTKRREKRINIQHVYFDAINLQAKIGAFGISPSQVSKEALNKPIINMKDFSEDFGKAMNAHAAFAICRTVEEQELGVARIVPVVQREGVAQASGATCLVKMNEERMDITEITYEEYEDIAGEMVVKTDMPDDSKRGRRKAPKVDTKNLTDD